MKMIIKDNYFFDIYHLIYDYYLPPVYPVVVHNRAFVIIVCYIIFIYRGALL